MKINWIKTALPLMVFMLAIVFAFASNVKTIESDTLVNGYIYQNGLCKEITVDCKPGGVLPCKYGFNDVFVHKDNETTCREKMSRLP